MIHFDLSHNYTIPPCVATIGFFDGVHMGHQFLIEQLTNYAAMHNLASLLITFRTHPRQVMQSDYTPALLTTYEEKRNLLSTTKADYCATLLFTQAMAALSAQEFMSEVLAKKLNVRTLIIGYDHRFGHNRTEGFDDYLRYGQEIGMQVIKAEALTLNQINVSSSVVRSLLLAGEVELASKCLNRPYCLTGIVTQGFNIGHELGFPTANIDVDDKQKLIPGNGVYAVKVNLTQGEVNLELYGMLNIGVRPTIDNGKQTTIEVHLLDFNQDIYGHELTLYFMKRLRDEHKFKSKGELIKQLQLDEEEVRLWVNKNIEV